MSFTAWLILAIIIMILLIMGVVMLFLWIRRRLVRLSGDFVESIFHHIFTKVKTLPKNQQIIEYDKILDKILGELGYVGTLAQKLQLYQKSHILPQSVWRAHRERNNLVHEIDYSLPHDEVVRHVNALETEVSKILKRRY